MENLDWDMLKVASKVDFPKKVIFGFSQAYSTLLNQLGAMKDLSEQDMNLPPCIELQRHGDSWIYLAHNGKLHIGNSNAELDAVSFALKKDQLFVITETLCAFKTTLSRIDEIYVHKDYPMARIFARGDNVVFLSVTGSLFFGDLDDKAVDGSFVDVAVGTTAVYALNEDGDLYRFVDKKLAARIHLRDFVVAIAAADDTLVCLTATRQLLTIPEGTKQRLDFDYEIVKSLGSRVVIAGEGLILLVDSSGQVVTLRYSDRIGRLLDAAEEADGIVLCGSIGRPMKVLYEPVISHEEPGLDSVKTLLQKYDKDSLLSVFEKSIWQSFIHVLSNDFESIRKSEHLLEFVPYLHHINEDSAMEVFHAIIVQGNGDKLPDSVLHSDFARKCFVWHPEDLRTCDTKQLFSLLPNFELHAADRLDPLSARLLQGYNHSAVVPSLRFKEGRLFVFSCGHVLNKDEMLASVNEVKDLCATYGLSQVGQDIFDAYLAKSILMQCPRCLHQRLQLHLSGR